MKKTIVVIGARSALAQDVIPVLAKEHTIVTAGRSGCELAWDISKPGKLPKDVDAIINFAAAFGGDSDAEITDAYRTNVEGVLNVCIAGKEAEVSHIVHISSLSAVLDQTSPYYSVYALTKRQGDELAEFYCRLNSIPLTILRPSQIYGDGDSFVPHQPFFYQIVDSAQKGEDIVVYGKNDALRNYIHSADVAEAIARSINQQLDGVYTCMSPTDSAFSDIAKTAQKVFGSKGNIIFDKEKPDIPDNIFTNDTPIFDQIDYTPQVTIEKGTQRMKEYRERGAK